MKNFNNIDERVVDDLKKELKAQSKLKIAAASFSIYAYEELKKELESRPAYSGDGSEHKPMIYENGELIK